jgi:hypothetical protein
MSSGKKNYKYFGKLIIFIIIAIICIIIYSDYYRTKVEAFALQNLNLVNYFDTTNDGNRVLLSDNYVGVLSDGYNQIVKSDEAAIKNIYDDTLVNSNLVKQLMNADRQNKQVGKHFPVNSKVKTIKSRNNSQFLSTFTNDTDKYGVVVNDKCLTVSGTCTDAPYCLTDCQAGIYTSNSQKFYPTTINTGSDASKIMGSPIKMSPNTVYPFNIFRSSVDDTCLSITNNGITLENCNLNDIKQQWQISPNENICVLN